MKSKPIPIRLTFKELLSLEIEKKITGTSKQELIRRLIDEKYVKRHIDKINKGGKK